jgi:hypothetical protein
VVLCEALGEHVFHEEVDLVYGIELSQVFAICRLLLGNLTEISEPQRLHILVLEHIIERALFPAVLDVPVHLVLGPLLHLLFVLHTVGVLAVLPKLRLLLFEFLTLSEHI